PGVVGQRARGRPARRLRGRGVPARLPRGAPAHGGRLRSRTALLRAARVARLGAAGDVERPAGDRVPMASAALTTRRAVVADAETMVRNAILGIATWRAFTPADGTGPTAGHRVEMTRYFLSRSDAFGLLADVAGEPAGHFLMFRATWDEPNSVILGQLFVRPAWWGTGLAEHLHAA